MRKLTKFGIVKFMVMLQAFWAAFFSFMHIVSVGLHFEMGWQAWCAPIVIDGMAVLGMLGRDHAAKEVRRIANILAFTAGAASLACNVYAGENVGQRVWGVIVVLGFVAAEAYLATLLRHGNASKHTVKAATSAARSEAAKKGHATRKAREVQAQKEKRAADRAAKAAAKSGLSLVPATA